MSKILYIQASPRGGRSRSITVANAFVEACKAAHPKDEITTLNLFEMAMPSFDGLAVDAKYKILRGKEASAAEAEAWKVVEKIIADFKSADKYVIATPMWNFGIPYPLKQYVDILVQPSYTFSYDPEKGYTGLVTGKPAMVVSARGAAYASGETKGFDMQKPYVELILGFMGFTDVRSIVIEPTLMGGPDVANQQADAGVAEAKEKARSF